MLSQEEEGVILGEFAKKTFISFSVTFKDSFRQGKVIGIDLEKQHVLLNDGEEIFFSHLILATGSDGPFPGKFNKIIDIQAAIQTYEDMAKEVTPKLAFSKEGGLDYLSFGTACQRVDNLHALPLHQFKENTVVKTDKGIEIVTDMVILCTGIKVNSSAYNSSFSDKLASNGALKVNEHLQVKGYDNIYAIGDCADVDEPKMAYHAGLHADVAVTNIINSLTQKPLKIYTPGSLTFLISLGRNDGVGQINGCYIGHFLVTVAKSKDLFVSKSWKKMDQQMPC
ncbi:hypothetical protein JD844_006384 [Phrynosoma platyrhinos]|uniref:Ferroptosis suppressor protein 1 n=1 Tax=Phrynosoma platyrhinos TaxID=52577 RepID=A0ABQ7T228_PHRPL|nr:hypothetical protein JD844_006384 [Phrynosoma platyrhinos]